MQKFPELETERLHLVQIGHQHVQAYFDILSLDVVTRYYGSESLTNIDEAKVIIESFQQLFAGNRGIRWGIVLKETNELIGTIGYHNLNKRGKRAEIGFEIHPSQWRKGIMSEAVVEALQYAFEKMKLLRVGAITFPANEASNQLLGRIGFKQEGLLRSYLFQNEKTHDAFVHSMLKSEWELRYKKREFEIEERLAYTDHMTEIIRKAEREGHFEDLPGKGKPLNIGRNYLNPSEAQLYKTLKDNHVLPRWVQLGKEIDALKDEISTLDGKDKRKKVKEINKKTKEYNYACPPPLQRNMVSE